jgi:hypothetical protein
MKDEQSRVSIRMLTADGKQSSYRRLNSEQVDLAGIADQSTIMEADRGVLELISGIESSRK